MSKIKIEKIIDFHICIKVNIEKEIIKQKFEFITANKKYLKYAYDKRFLLKEKLEKLIEKRALPCTFVSRCDEENMITISYEYNDIKEKKPEYVNLSFYVPPYAGCNYCRKKEMKDKTIFCKEKKKYYNASIKTCPLFFSIKGEVT